MIREPNVTVFVRDSVALDENEYEFLRYVYSIQPDVIFWEPPTVTIDDEVDLAQVLQKLYPRPVVVWGGAHVTALPHETADLVGKSVHHFITGEYELALVDLVKSLMDQKIMPPRFIEGRKVDMKTCPWPARFLFPTNNAPDLACYKDGFYSTFPAAVMWASRGCIHDCPYCAEVNLIEGAMRNRLVKDVVAEMESLALRGVRHVYFDDNNFTGNVAFTGKLCDEMILRGLPHRVSWSAMASFMGRTDEALIRKMKEAGCTGLKFGVDSADETVLKELRRPLDLEKCKALCRLCNRIGIKTHATMAIGHFSDTKETLNKALAYLKELSVDTIQVSVAAPFPGLEMFNRLKAANRLASTHWRDFSGIGKSVVRFPDMTPEYVEAFRMKMDHDWVQHKLRHDWGWKWRHFKYVWRDCWSNPGLVIRRIKQVIHFA